MRENYTPQQIQDAFDIQCDIHGDDRSTEFLVSVTADALDIEYEDVIDGLVESAEEE